MTLMTYVGCAIRPEIPREMLLKCSEIVVGCNAKYLIDDEKKHALFAA